MREHVSRTNSAVRTTVVCRAAGSVTMIMTVAITQMRRSVVCISTDNDLCVPASCLHTWDCMYASYRSESSGLLLFVTITYVCGRHCGYLSYVMAHSRYSLMHLTSCCLYSSFHTDPLAWLRGRSLLPPNHLPIPGSLSFSSLLISPWFHSCLWQESNCSFFSLVEKLYI